MIRAILLGLALIAVGAEGARASEAATNIYLLGSQGPMAGFVPPPGTYLSDYKYYYQGSAEGEAALAFSLRRGVGANVDLSAEVHVQAFVEVPSVLAVTPHKIWGGNVGFGFATPVGWQNVDVDLTAQAALTLPPPLNITLEREARLELEDDLVAFGDPQPFAIIGWHDGNWHWKLGTILNVPIGSWERRRLANIGFGYWALDGNAAVTWLDPKIGFEVSTSAGFTYNWENPDIDYKSGTMFHLEWAVMQHFSKDFSLGLVGYHYQQVTGDSGAGARLGSFEGRVTALGPGLTWNFQLGQTPVSTSLRYYREFNVENRLEGDAGLLTLTMPLSAGAR
jgi:hypothetical protein